MPAKHRNLKVQTTTSSRSAILVMPTKPRNPLSEDVDVLGRMILFVQNLHLTQSENNLPPRLSINV